MGRLRATRAAPTRRMPSGTASAQDGFTLVEVLVAMLVFIVVTTASITLLMQGLQIIRENSDRVMAANIARWQLEYWRSLPVTEIPVGLTVGLPDGTTGLPDADLANVHDAAFTVRTTANWVSTGQTSSSCASGVTPGQDYKRVSVQVQSANMSGPVTLDTVVFADMTGVVTNTASLIVLVSDQLGNPVSDVLVTGTDTHQAANSFALVTGADGCLYLPGLTASTGINITIARTGYIAKTGTSTTTSVALVSQEKAQARFIYAAAASVTFSSGDATYPYPPTMPVTWAENLTGSSPNLTTAGATVSSLWPLTEGLTAWGPCDGTHTTLSLTPGATTASVLPAAQVKVRGLEANVLVTATCSGTTVSLGRTNSLGVLKVSLPFGNWSFASSGQTQTLLAPLAAPLLGVPEPVTTVSFTLANLDGEAPSPSPSPSPSGSGSDSASPSASPTASATP
jgi:prepilin-type N-terminal cleavage/methylation domain-containing protein